RGPGTPATPGAPATPGMPGTPPDALPPADPGPIARAPEAGTQPANTLNPGLFGDLIGVSARSTSTGFAQIPVLPRYAGLKVSDNDGPRPSDRFFFSFNHYSEVNQGFNAPGSPALELDRQIIGFESLIGEDASWLVRLPFVQLSGSPAVEGSEIGDLTVGGKYAIVNDRFTGNVFSVGLNLTLPTGGRADGIGALPSGAAAPRAVFVQPWTGAAWNSGDTFYQGVSSLVLPTDPVYPTVWFNSFGVGYWLYRNPTDTLVRGIAPVAELHVNTPLTNRGDDALILMKDQVNLTTGLYVQFPRLTVGGSVCVPLAGPLPYDVETMLSVNYQF
ncbi:MAG TPA: hypothetical protein VM597_34555, partial [Gemmataceae bacterium]|nr:hypothetical protein [Gemmataceae bacterium]